MASASDAFLDAWHRLVAARDLVALEAILAEDVTLGAPPYWDALEGRPVVLHLLSLILETIEGFTYHREWHASATGQGEIALEFKGRVGDLDLQGIDLISLNARGQVQNLDVLIRPMNALSALRDRIAPRMIAFFAEQAKPS